MLVLECAAMMQYEVLQLCMFALRTFICQGVLQCVVAC